MSILFTYHWKIPVEMRDAFCREWKELTEVNIPKYGLINAEMFSIEPDNFISITTWPDEASWKKWKDDDSNHEYREKWRLYRISGPEKMARREVVTQ